MFHKKERQALSGVLNGSEARSRRAILAKKSFDYAGNPAKNAGQASARLRSGLVNIAFQDNTGVLAAQAK